MLRVSDILELLFAESHYKHIPQNEWPWPLFRGRIMVT